MTAVTLTLALSASFVVLALASGVARLVIYTGTCAAALRLRHVPAAADAPGPFVTPGGALVPVLAIAVSVAILAGATREQLLGGLVGLAAGALLFLLNGRRSV